MYPFGQSEPDYDVMGACSSSLSALFCKVTSRCHHTYPVACVMGGEPALGVWGL